MNMLRSICMYDYGAEFAPKDLAPCVLWCKNGQGLHVYSTYVQYVQLGLPGF